MIFIPRHHGTGEFQIAAGVHIEFHILGIIKIIYIRRRFDLVFLLHLFQAADHGAERADHAFAAAERERIDLLPAKRFQNQIRGALKTEFTIIQQLHFCAEAVFNKRCHPIVIQRGGIDQHLFGLIGCKPVRDLLFSMITLNGSQMKLRG